MKFKKLNNKAQGLPLNTVVLAILVILVLVIIIVYFTTNMSKTGDSLDQNTQGVNACALGSYIIPADKYDGIPTKNPATYNCATAGEGWIRIYSASTGDDNYPVCCAHKSK